ncbi:hypothetical protein CF7_0120 [Staphylococcus phage CF7]|nr:hypothetical protein CF7_0120 [Staphylococcus phage CF7]
MNITAEVLRSVLDKMIERNIELTSVKVKFRKLVINKKIWIDISNAQHDMLFTGLIDGEPHYLKGSGDLSEIMELLEFDE